MSGTIKLFGRSEFVQLFPAVKPIRFEVLPAIDAPVIGVLKEPGLKGAAVRIELIGRFEDIQEDPLDGLFRLSIIAQDGAGDPEDQRAMPFE
jgi:hypothetical protein